MQQGRAAKLIDVHVQGPESIITRIGSWASLLWAMFKAKPSMYNHDFVPSWKVKNFQSTSFKALSSECQKRTTTTLTLTLALYIWK